MKAFIDRIFKNKKQKELLDEIANTEVTEQATVEAIIKENKKIITKQIEQTLKEYTDTKEHTDTKDD